MLLLLNVIKPPFQTSKVKLGEADRVCTVSASEPGCKSGSLSPGPPRHGTPFFLICSVILLVQSSPLQGPMPTSRGIISITQIGPI